MGINMKKTLFSTTALATAGLLAASAGDAFGQAAAPAAEKMKLSLGGYMTQYVGYAEQDSDWETANANYFKNFDSKSDSEVYFLGSMALDNGLTISVRVDLEVDTQLGAGGQTIDESYMNIGSTTLGTLTLGATNGAGSDLLVQAPASGLLNFYNTDMNAWLVDAGTTVPASASAGYNAGGGNDDNLVKYVSPSLAGFRVGISYANDQADSGGQPTVSTVDQWETGLQWAGKFGDFGLRASGIYWATQGASDTAQVDGWGVGGDVTFADFSFGGAYGEARNNGTGNVTAGGTSTFPGETWNVGLKYAPGPFDVGVTYGRRTSTVTTADPDDASYSKLAIGGTYLMGPGVNVGVQVIRAVTQAETNAQASENTAWAVVSGIKVDF